MNADIARLKERLTFEYVFYKEDEDGLVVYLMNCGTINDTTVKTVYVYSSGGEIIKVFSNITLVHFNGDEIADQDLDKGEEGCFMLSPLSLVTGVSYSIRVVTGRGSIFDCMFVA